MPTPALLLLIATLLPLLSFTLLAILGKRFGNPLAGWIATALIAGAMGCSFAAMIAWYERGQLAGLSWGPDDKPIHLAARFLAVTPSNRQEHPGFLDLVIDVDSLTIAMFNMATLVALLTHFYALGYMRRDKQYPQFFAVLSLMCFAMLGLFLSGTLLQWLMFLQLAGLGSFLLIGFWHEKPVARAAAIKAFLIGRVGDIGLLIGMGIIFHLLGSTTLLQMDQWLGGAGEIDRNSAALLLPNGTQISATLLTILGIALFATAAVTSAQFPLHVWLTDAMESPCPASALAYGGAFVGAGGYMVGRLFPILTPDAKLFIAIIGLITLTVGALCALAQTDVKKLLACATMSQLGLIMLALGVGSWSGGLFHLITLSFFQTLIILAAGSVLRATHQQRDLFQLGGLLNVMPVTAVAFAIGILAISQTPLFSGYYSGGMILAHAGAFVTFAGQNGHDALYRAFFIFPAVAAFLTPFFMMRCWMLVFWGRPHNPQMHSAVRETTTLWLPLVMLSGLSILGGSRLLDVKVLLQQSVAETEHYINAVRDPAAPPFTGFAQAWPLDLDLRLANPDETHSAELAPIKALEDTGEQLRHHYLAWAPAIGLFLGFIVYCFGTALPDAILAFAPFRMIYLWLRHRIFFDELYASVFAAVTLGLAEICAIMDRHIFEGMLNYPLKSLRPAKNSPDTAAEQRLEQNRAKV